MKKTNIRLGFVVAVLLVGGYLLRGNFKLLVSAQEVYDVVQGTLDGDVIQANDQIINIARLEQFYKQVNRNGEDSIVVAIPYSDQKYDVYELHTSDGKLKLYYDIIEDGQGRKEYKVKVYDSIKKTYKQDQVTYVLVNEQEERAFLSYSLK